MLVFWGHFDAFWGHLVPFVLMSVGFWGHFGAFWGDFSVDLGSFLGPEVYF